MGSYEDYFPGWQSRGCKNVFTYGLGSREWLMEP